jgi:acetyl/propionyl-CoA carboxylase alpha subunit
MSVNADLKAGLILDDFSRQLTGAQIGYVLKAGTHQFTIEKDGVTYQVEFSERVLLEHPIRDLEKAVPRIIRQLLVAGGPRRLKVGDGAPAPALL